MVAVAFSSSTGSVYAAASGAGETDAHISVFSAGAAGDAVPTQVIQGPATGLQNTVIPSIAVSPCTGDIYAVTLDSQNIGQVAVFDRLASGNIAPKRVFADASHLFDVSGGRRPGMIAIPVPNSAPAPVPAVPRPGWLILALVLAATFPGLTRTLSKRRALRFSQAGMT
jgi:hypothetical protein